MELQIEKPEKEEEKQSVKAPNIASPGWLLQ